MVTSPVKEATVSLDGEKAVELPLIGEVKPGKHRIKVIADGFFDEEREVLAVEGSLSRTTCRCARGRRASRSAASPGRRCRSTAARWVRRRSRLRWSIAPGRHLIAVSRNGSKAFTTELTLDRGEARRVDAALPTTGQRITRYSLLGLGAGGIIVGIIAGGVTFKYQADATKILD